MSRAIQSELKECVILVHGLVRTSRPMSKMNKALQTAGYETYNCSYPSREHPIELLSEKFIPQAIEHCRKTFTPDKIHFVAHSLGGILIRYYLAQHKLESLGRVVLLAPPNTGSELVDKLSGLQLFRLINGPAGSQLGTEESSLPNALDPIDYEVGIIAGNKNISLLAKTFIPGESDGKVSTKRARLEGMSDFLVVPHTHTFIMNQKKVIDQTLEFFANGKFVHDRKLF